LGETPNDAIEQEERPLAESELRYLVLAAQREGNRALSRQLSALDLTPSQAEILMVLNDFGPLTLKNLGELIVCEAGSPSRIVDTLVGRMLVARMPSPTDRRAVLLELSRAGAAVVPSIRRIENDLDAEVARAFTAEETAVLTSALRRYLGFTSSGPVLERRFPSR